MPKLVRPLNLILGEARQALGMTQRTFGYAVGASHRTAVRWDARQSRPGEHQLRKLAGLLLPAHRALAEEVAAAMGETLAGLGLEPAPTPVVPSAPAVAPAPAPAPAVVPRPDDLIDIVVLAAMEHTGMPSPAIRSLLHVAFKRAREIGLTAEIAEKALRPPRSDDEAQRNKRLDDGASADKKASGKGAASKP